MATERTLLAGALAIWVTNSKLWGLTKTLWLEQPTSSIGIYSTWNINTTAVFSKVSRASRCGSRSGERLVSLILAGLFTAVLYIVWKILWDGQTIGVRLLAPRICATRRYVLLAYGGRHPEDSHLQYSPSYATVAPWKSALRFRKRIASRWWCECEFYSNISFWVPLILRFVQRVSPWERIFVPEQVWMHSATFFSVW